MNSAGAPLLLPVLSLTTGVVLVEYGIGIAAGLTLIATAIVVYLILLRLSRSPNKGLRLNRCHYIWVILMFAGTGITVKWISSPEEIGPDGVYHIRGRVTDRTISTQGDRLTIYLTETQPCDETGRPTGDWIEIHNTSVRMYLNPTIVRTGDIVEACGKIKKVTPRPDKLQDSYAISLQRRGIPYSMTLNTPQEITIRGHKETAMSFASGIRDRIDILIAHTPLRRDTKTFLSAMLLGDRSMLDQQKRQTFADAGVAHVLALSGMHLGIISIFILGILLPINIFGLYKTRYVITLIVLWGYALLTGLSPTIIRAAVMATCMITAILLERKKSALNALCAAVFILIIFDPMCIYDIGMQLSVACVACLILFATPLNLIDHRRNPILYKIGGAIIATLTATLGTWVITAWHFSRFPLNFLPVNIIVLPLIPWFAGVSILYIFLYGIGIESAPARHLLDAAYAGFHRLAEWGGEGAIGINIGSLTLILWISGIVLLAIGINMIGKKRKTISAVACCVMIIAVATVGLFKIPQPEGFIIGGNNNRIMLTDYTEGEEREIEFKRGEVSMLETHGKKIGVLDGKLTNVRFPGNFREMDILIIGSNFRGDLTAVDSVFRPGKIVLHHSIGAKRTAEYSESYAGRSGLYSLRNNGPLHVFQ